MCDILKLYGRLLRTPENNWYFDIRSDTVLITKLLFFVIIHESKGKENSGEGNVPRKV